MAAPWLVVGLGNPGPTYASTRHNVGYMVADELAGRASARFAVPRGMRAEVCQTRLAASGMGGVGADADRVILVKPRTFMNDSGVAVARACAFFKVVPDHLIVIHDELDLDFLRMRAKFGGGDNGHNGLKSIRASLDTGDFYRVRFGIGRPPGRQDAAAYVLAPIPAALREDYAVEVSRNADAVQTLIAEGLTGVQNRFNS